MTEKRPIKVFIVDDSPLMRIILTKIINDSPEFALAGTASNGKIALDRIAKTKPDVITMDIEMPEMDGLTCLTYIMKEMPTPVIIISSHVKKEEKLTITALELGAVDFIPKPNSAQSGPFEDLRKEIYTKIRTASLIKVKTIIPQMIDDMHTEMKFKKHLSQSHQSRHVRACENLVSIGVSTGGPNALAAIIPTIPADINASFLIVQHMPSGFTHALANYLNGISEIEVTEAKGGDPLVSGKVYIAHGDYHLTVERYDNKYFTSLNQNGYVSSFRPSIDVLMKSTAHYFRDNNIGVIMSGMCADGVEGVKYIKENNGIVIAQDKETSAIYGMNQIAIQLGLADYVVPLNKIIPTILDQLNS